MDKNKKLLVVLIGTITQKQHTQTIKNFIRKLKDADFYHFKTPEDKLILCTPKDARQYFQQLIRTMEETEEETDCLVTQVLTYQSFLHLKKAKHKFGFKLHPLSLSPDSERFSIDLPLPILPLNDEELIDTVVLNLKVKAKKIKKIQAAME